MIKYLDKVNRFEGDAYFYTKTKCASTLEEAIEKCNYKNSNGFYRIIIRNRNHIGNPVSDMYFNQIEGFRLSCNNSKKRIIYIDSDKSMILYEECLFHDDNIIYRNVFDYEFIYGNKSIDLGSKVKFKNIEYLYGFYIFHNFNNEEISVYNKESIMNSAFENDSVLGPIVFEADNNCYEWYIPLAVLEKE